MFLHGVFDLAVRRGIAVGGGTASRNGPPRSTSSSAAGEDPGEEVRIKLIKDWADFVFHPDHRLTTLPEAASYIRNHHHLPDMPSAAEVANDGVRLEKMQAKLLRKIEELTLHAIEQQKTIESLQARLRQLEQDRFHHVQDR